MGTQIAILLVVEEYVEIHDGHALASRKGFERDAVETLQVALVKTIGNGGTPESGIVGVIGRSLRPFARVDRQAHPDLSWGCIGHPAKSPMLPAWQRGGDGHRLAADGHLAQLLRFPGVAPVYRQWHLCLNVQPYRQEETTDKLAYSISKVHFRAFSNNSMNSGQSNSFLLCPNWKYTFLAPFDGLVQMTGWSPILMLVGMV